MGGYKSIDSSGYSFFGVWDIAPELASRIISEAKKAYDALQE